MSKDFEQAYRELAESEIPDLWDRIEAGLESKSTPEQIEESEAEKEAETAEEAVQETVFEKKQHRKKWAHFNRYSGIAAAAVCVAVIIPAAVFLFRSGNKTFGNGYSGGTMLTEGIDTAAAADESLEFAADEEESCEAAPEEMDAGAGALDEAAEEPSGKEEGGQVQNNTQGSAEDKAMAEMEDAAQMADELKDLKKESQSSAKQESAARETGEEGTSASIASAEESTVYEHVEIKVTDIENVFEREDGSPPGTLYTVTVQKDASGRLKEGEELVVDVPASSSYALVRDGVFEVDLVYKGNGTYGLAGSGLSAD